MKLAVVSTCGCALVLSLIGRPAIAHADTGDYFGQDAPTSEVSYRRARSRTPGQRWLITGLAGGAVLSGAVGVGFHLDSRSKSDEVSAVGDLTGRTYTLEVDETRSAAIRSRNVAAISYGVGAGLAVAAVIALVVTDPGSELVTTGAAEDVDVVPVPVPGGGGVGARWSF